MQGDCLVDSSFESFSYWNELVSVNDRKEEAQNATVERGTPGER